ncbi:unnamed protein product [Brassica oleracea var. botrytis]
MTDNIFEGLPPPSSQQQELSNSSNPNESKDESRSPAPTLVLKSSLKRSKPAESAPNVSAPPALKSALKLAVTSLRCSKLQCHPNLTLCAVLGGLPSKTPCIDRLVRAGYHTLFSAAQDVAEVNILENLMLKGVELN